MHRQSRRAIRRYGVLDRMARVYVNESVAHRAELLVRFRELMYHLGLRYTETCVCRRVPPGIGLGDWLLWVGGSKRLPALPDGATGQVRSSKTGLFGLVHGIDGATFLLALSRWDELEALGGHARLWGSVTNAERGSDELHWTSDRLADSLPRALAQPIDWNRLERDTRGRIEAAGTPAEHLRAWEWLFGRIQDSHTKVASLEGANACRRVHCGIYGTITRPGRFVVARVMAGSAAEDAGVVAGDGVRGIDGLGFPAWLRRENRYWVRSSPHFRRAVQPFMPWFQPLGTTLALELDTGRKWVRFDDSYPGFLHYLYEGKPEPMAFREMAPGLFRLAVRYFTMDQCFIPRCEEALMSVPAGGHLGLDLRGCAGGNGLASLALAGMLLPKGAVISRHRGRCPGGALTPWAVVRNDREPVYTGPLTVVMDELCASAAEGVIGALKSARRARLVGRRSGGGSGFPRAYRSAGGVSFTCSSWEETTPEGEPIEGHGVTTRPWRPRGKGDGGKRRNEPAGTGGFGSPTWKG